MRLLVLCYLFASPISAFAQDAREGTDWPWFLGPDHTGVSSETNLLTEWPDEGPPLLWSKKVGTGFSAPSVRGSRLVLHHRKADKELTQCFDAATGQQKWGYDTPSDFVDPYKYNNGPRCSPVLSQDHCYTLGAAGHLACLELETGKKVWSKNLADDYKIPRAFFGVGCTPILEGNKLIVLVGGQDNSGVVAFDSKTGNQLWKAVGKKTWDGVQTPKRGPYKWTGTEQVVSYSSPVAATINGKRHILCLTRQGLVSLDPETGTENFKYWFRAVVHESVNAARPVVIGDQILLSAAYRMGSVLLQVNSTGDGVSEVWKNNKNLLAHWSTPIVVDGYVYGFSGRHENEGELRCVDLKTGTVKWSSTGDDPETMGKVVIDKESKQYVNQKTGKTVPRPYFGRGSKIRVGDKFIILGERGLLASAKINPEKYEEISRTEFKQIHQPSWTAPVLSRGRLFLRCEDALICLDLARK